jgi:hypothetical protein
MRGEGSTAERVAKCCAPIRSVTQLAGVEQESVELDIAPQIAETWSVTSSR